MTWEITTPCATAARSITLLPLVAEDTHGGLAPAPAVPSALPGAVAPEEGGRRLVPSGVIALASFAQRDLLMDQAHATRKRPRYRAPLPFGVRGTFDATSSPPKV